MKARLSVVLILAIGLGLVACSGGSEGEMAAKKEFDAQAVMASLVTDLDPACGMEVTVDVLHDTTTYEGKIYGFCSASCKTTFGEDPATLVASLPIEGEHEGQHEEHQGEEHND